MEDDKKDNLDDYIIDGSASLSCDLTNEIKKHKAENENLKAKIMRLVSHWANNLDESRQLRNYQEKELEQLRVSTKDETRALREQLAELESINSSLRKQLQDERDQVQQREVAIKQLRVSTKEETRALRFQLAELESSNSSLAKQLQDEREQDQQREAAINQLRVSTEDETRALREQLAELESSNSSLAKQLGEDQEASVGHVAKLLNFSLASLVNEKNDELSELVKKHEELLKRTNEFEYYKSDKFFPEQIKSSIKQLIVPIKVNENGSFKNC